jgi:AcrR family transcriptional regulator
MITVIIATPAATVDSVDVRIREPRGGAETQRRLLDAAAAEIASVGYDRATLAGIARRAGLTTGAVYSTFGSKWDLLRAVVAERTHALTVDGEGDLAERLHAAVGQPDARQTVILQVEAQLLALRHPELLDEVLAAGAVHREQLAGQLDASGDLAPEDRATLLSATVLGLQLTQLFYPDAVAPDLYRAALERVLS